MNHLSMSEWLDNQKQSSSNIRKLLQERIEKANPRRELSCEEEKRLTKLEAIAEKLNCGENVQNRQLQTWLSEQEYEQLNYEWQEQLELREELKYKPIEINAENTLKVHGLKLYDRMIDIVSDSHSEALCK